MGLTTPDVDDDVGQAWSLMVLCLDDDDDDDGVGQAWSLMVLCLAGGVRWGPRTGLQAAWPARAVQRGDGAGRGSSRNLPCAGYLCWSCSHRRLPAQGRPFATGGLVRLLASTCRLVCLRHPPAVKYGKHLDPAFDKATKVGEGEDHDVGDDDKAG